MEDTSPPSQHHKTFREEAWDTVRFAFIALLVVVPVRMFVAQPFFVSGASMAPTFSDRQYLIVDEISYRFIDPERGDVIIFKYPKNPSQYFIKRVIGLPKETVIINQDGKVIIRDRHGASLSLNEPYVTFPKPDTVEVALGPDEYFVMGDNRAGSYDSRLWGPLDRDLIVGRALVRLFPLSMIDIFPGEFKQVL